jgi:hypothetical protein
MWVAQEESFDRLTDSICGRDAEGQSAAEPGGGAMQQRQRVTCWILVGVGALLILLAAFGIVRIAALWHLVGSLAR